MKSILTIIVLIVAGVIYFSKQQIDPTRDHLVFEDDIEQVADSLKKMEYLISKFPEPETGIVNYFVDNRGYLYLNSKKMGPLRGAINNQKVRDDLVFKDFSEKEINQFFRLMAYLSKNHITFCSKEPSLELFIHAYRIREVETDENSRFIIVVHQRSDTTSANFKRYFEVIDFQENLALLRSK